MWGSSSSSKASASTRCQKCLQYGHYSYECKVAVKDRPYTTRPSRTQQLLNPKLQTKLTEEKLDLEPPKEGISDHLSRPKTDRRKPRSPSVSSHASSDSAETISTNASRSPSPPQKRKRITAQGDSDTRRGRDRRHETLDRPRRRGGHEDDDGRRPRSRGGEPRSMSFKPDHSEEEYHRRARGHRSRTQSTSPRRDHLGHRNSRTYSPHKRRVNAALRSPSPFNGRERPQSQSPRKERDGDEPRRRSRPRSPRREGGKYRYNGQSRSRSPPTRFDGYNGGDRRVRRDDHRKPMHGQYRHDDGGTVTYGKAPRERSLSPFSKRAALTAALNRGG